MGSRSEGCVSAVQAPDMPPLEVCERLLARLVPCSIAAVVTLRVHASVLHCRMRGGPLVVASSPMQAPAAEASRAPAQQAAMDKSALLEAAAVVKPSCQVGQGHAQAADWGGHGASHGEVHPAAKPPPTCPHLPAWQATSTLCQLMLTAGLCADI